MEARIQALIDGIAHLARHEVFRIGPVSISTTVINTWIVMAVLFFIVWLLTRNGFRERPRGVQTFLEIVMEFFYGLIDESMGKAGRRFVALGGSLFIFILALNISWFIPGMVPPTTDIMSTAAFAVTAIVLIQLLALREKGIGGYFKHFMQPTPLMAPMNVLEEVIKPFSMSIRLFGNMFGEKMVVTILFALVPLLFPVPVMMLGVLMGAIQAYIFTLLSITYLAAATQGHH